jgi:hypothetical protein
MSRIGCDVLTELDKVCGVLDAAGYKDSLARNFHKSELTWHN